jgi:hypothetical protein
MAYHSDQRCNYLYIYIYIYIKEERIILELINQIEDPEKKKILI